MDAQVKVWFEEDGRPVFGEGRYRLLRTIEQEGSISKAAKKLNISFKNAWAHLGRAEQNLGIKLLERTRGGTGGGHTLLTDRAKELISIYERLNNDVKVYTEKRFTDLRRNREQY
jgi:molybdate transport system regulatory protein